MLSAIGDIAYSAQRFTDPVKFQQPAPAQPPAEKPDVRAGFGADTVSPGAAALQTIRRTFDQAQQLIPSMQEMREAIRQARIEQESAQAQRQSALESRQQRETPQRTTPSGDTGAAGTEESSSTYEQMQEARTGATFEAVSLPQAPRSAPESVPGDPMTTGKLNLLA